MRIIALDGGGIRGLITAVWLSRLEEMLGGRLRDHCDILAGTSTGAILACALARGIPADEIAAMYVAHGRTIFPAARQRWWSRLTRTFTQGPSAPKYDDDGLERILKAYLGEQAFGAMPPRPLLIVTAYNVTAREPRIFKHRWEPGLDTPLWQIAKASASAPVYFPATIATLRGADAPLIDGGVCANNPTLCAIGEATRLGSPLGAMVVGSFGAGRNTRSISGRQAREWGAAEWALPIIDVLFDGASAVTDYVAAQLIPPDQYFRFQTRLDKALDDIDNAERENLNALRIMAERHLSHEGGERRLESLAAALRDHEPEGSL